MSFSQKDPEEIITVTFDFSAITLTPSNPVVSAVAAGGKDDTSPSAILSGVPVVSGATVLQKIVAGQSGTTYSIRCRIDAPDGSRYVLTELLPVQTF